MLTLLRLIGSAAIAWAQAPGAILDKVGSSAPRPSFCFNQGCFSQVTNVLAADLLDFVYPLGVIFMTIAAVKLLTKSDEGELANARRAVGTVFAGVVLAVLAREGILYSAATNVEGGRGAEILCTEFIGIMSVFEELAGFIAIIAISITGIRVLATFGGDDALSSMRQALGAILLGLFILVAKGVVFPAIGLNTSGCGVMDSGISPVGPIKVILGIFKTVLDYLQIAAILILVILGLLLIINLGNEEQFIKLKGYLFRLAIGFIILAMAGFILNIVIIG